MSYIYRTTYRQDRDTYVEDRGYAHAVKRGDELFPVLDAEFGKLLAVGQTAQRAMDGHGWEVIEGFPLLENAKEVKLNALRDAWLKAEAKSVINSSVGFAIDANERARSDITGLITDMEATGQETTQFCAADNTFHTVTIEQLKTMRLEVIQCGQWIYNRKWQIRAAIERAASMDELNAINISFVGA